MNLLVGLPTMLLCLVLQLSFTFWSVRHYVRHSPRIVVADSTHRQIGPLLAAMLIMALGNLVQIVLWASLFLLLGEFTEFYEAAHHSAVNFTSLGYGDFVMSKENKLLGPLEALNGVLMLGMTGAALMAILQQMIKALYAQRQPAE